MYVDRSERRWTDASVGRRRWTDARVGGRM